MGLLYYYDFYFKFFFSMVNVNVGHPVAQLVEALRYKPEGCGSIPNGVNWNFSLT